jgi:peroxiredoxin Q/BCP
LAGVIRIGEEAPSFTLPGTGGREYSLDDERGHAVVLAFYPADGTPTCTAQLSSYTAELERFTGLGARLFGISPQSVASHEAFAGEYGLAVTLLADVDKRVGASYGILGPLGFYRRSVVVIDAEGIVRFAHRALVASTYLRASVIEQAIRDAVAT